MRSNEPPNIRQRRPAMIDLSRPRLSAAPGVERAAVGKGGGRKGRRFSRIALRRCGMQKRVECECGWSLQTDDEAKLVVGVQQHAKQVHNMEGVTKDQVLAQARPA